MYYPLYYSQLVPQAGVEPALKFLLLRETTLPICLLGHCLVLPPGIEPGSTVLQTAAMTTSAKVAWYQRRESNPLKNANLALKGL